MPEFPSTQTGQNLVAELKSVQRQVQSGLARFEESYRSNGCHRFADSAYKNVISAIRKNAISVKQLEPDGVGRL